MRIHLAIQYPLTGILSKVRKNASRHLQMLQGVPFKYLVQKSDRCPSMRGIMLFSSLLSG